MSILKHWFPAGGNYLRKRNYLRCGLSSSLPCSHMYLHHPAPVKTLQRVIYNQKNTSRKGAEITPLLTLLPIRLPTAVRLARKIRNISG